MSAELAHALGSPDSKAGAGQSESRARRVAYVMSRFPKLTETFVLDEILEQERSGICVEIFPLWRESAKVIHPEALAIVARAHFTPTLNVSILIDNLRCFLRSPRRYVDALACVLRANLRSPRFLVAAIAIFPKACSFAERMRRLGIDHVHAHFASHPALAAFVVGRLADIPWSFTAHGSDLHREQAMLREKVGEARFVVAVSNYNRRFILDRVGEEFGPKIKVIHCGVDPECYARRSSVPGRLEIACVGKLHEVKGQAILLDACARLPSRRLPWHCHLIGDGPDRRALEARALRLGISEFVTFHGNCEREHVRALLTKMDVVAAPSVPTQDGRREGIPVVLMEAAACALPLIGSRLSGIPELIGDDETGLLVEPGDAAGLAAALVRLAEEPATRARLGDAARIRLEREFNLEENVATLRELIFTESAA